MPDGRRAWRREFFRLPRDRRRAAFFPAIAVAAAIVVVVVPQRSCFMAIVVLVVIDASSVVVRTDSGLFADVRGVAGMDGIVGPERIVGGQRGPALPNVVVDALALSRRGSRSALLRWCTLVDGEVPRQRIRQPLLWRRLAAVPRVAKPLGRGTSRRRGPHGLGWAEPVEF